jgi:hypothetical protein
MDLLARPLLSAPTQRDRPAYGVRRLTSVSELSRLEGPWHALDVRWRHPMARFAWAQAAAESFCDRGSLCLMASHVEGYLRAAAALTLRDGAAGTRLESLGVGELYEPTDLAGTDEEAIEAVCDAVACSGWPLALERVPANSPWIEHLRRAYSGRGWLRVAPANGSPFIPLDSTWRDPELNFNSGRRSDIRRARRRAESLGEVRAEIHSPRSSTDVAALLDTALAVEASGWKGERGSALAIDGRRGPFFRRYAEKAARLGTLRIALLHVGSQVAAMQIALEAENSFWLLKIGYRGSHAKCSPGQLLMLDTVAYAARRGLATYELLGSAAPWTALWTVEEHPCVAVRAYPFNSRGPRALAHDLGRSLRRRFRTPATE